MRKLMRSLVLAAVLSMGALGATALPAAADPAADLRAFVEAGFSGTSDAEYRAFAETLAASTDAPGLPHAAARALAGTEEDLHAFVDGGYLRAWYADERLRLARVLVTATHPSVYNGVQDALGSGDPQVWTAFLTTGLPQAQLADDRLAAATMLTGGANSSGPALDAAARVALEGTAAELREFIVNGQFTARALDAEAAVPAAPVAPPVPAQQPAQVAAPPAAAAPAPAAAQPARAVLAATGSSSGRPAALLAGAAILAGTGLVLVSRRRRQAA